MERVVVIQGEGASKAGCLEQPVLLPHRSRNSEGPPGSSPPHCGRTTPVFSAFPFSSMDISLWLRQLGITGGPATPRDDSSPRREVRNLSTQSVVACCVEIADRGPVRRRGLL